MGGLIARLGAALQWGRDRSRAFDHAVRMQNRMSRTRGSMLTNAITYSAFVSIFPILLLAVSVLGFVLSGDPSRQASLLDSVKTVIPGDIGSNVLQTVQSSKTATGIIGLVGGLLTGLGWLSSLRTGMRIVWSQENIGQNAILAKVQDALTLLGFAVLLVISTSASSTATGQAKHVAHLLVGDATPGLTTVLKVVGYGLTVLSNYVLFLFMFRRLSKVDRPHKRFRQGSLLAAVLFFLLQTVLFAVVQNSLDKSSQVYGAVIGGLFALLVYIRYITLIMMYSASWMATAPGEDDVLPSGTALLHLTDLAASKILHVSEEKAQETREKLATSLPGGQTAVPGGGVQTRFHSPEDIPQAPAEGPESTPDDVVDALVEDQVERPALARLASGGVR